MIHKSCLTKLNILNLIAYNFVVKAKDLGLIKILNYYEYRIYNIFSSHKIVCEQKVRESFVNLSVSSLKSRMSTREPILIKQNSYINSSLGIGPSNLLNEGPCQMYRMHGKKQWFFTKKHNHLAKLSIKTLGFWDVRMQPTKHSKNN